MKAFSLAQAILGIRCPHDGAWKLPFTTVPTPWSIKVPLPPAIVVFLATGPISTVATVGANC